MLQQQRNNNKYIITKIQQQRFNNKDLITNIYLKKQQQRYNNKDIITKIQQQIYIKNNNKDIIIKIQQTQFLTLNDNILFTTGFLNELNKSDSILGKTIRDDSFDAKLKKTQAREFKENSIAKKRSVENKKSDKTRIEDLTIQKLVDKFLSKDSISFIQIPPSKAPQKMIISAIHSKNSHRPERCPTVAENPTKQLNRQNSLQAKTEQFTKAVLSRRDTGDFARSEIPYPSSKRAVEVCASPHKIEIHKTLTVSTTAPKTKTHLRSKSQGKIIKAENKAAKLVLTQTRRSCSKVKIDSIKEMIKATEKELKEALSKPNKFNSERNSIVRATKTRLNSEITHSPSALQSKKKTEATPFTKSRKTLPGPLNSARSCNTPLMRGKTIQDKGNRKKLLIDIEELNRNLRKQKLEIDAKISKTTRALRRHNDYGSSRTPNPTRQKSKNGLLHNQPTEKPIQLRKNTKSRTDAKHCFSGDTAASVLNVLTTSRSITNLNKNKNIENGNYLATIINSRTKSVNENGILKKHIYSSTDFRKNGNKVLRCYPKQEKC